MTLKEEIIRHSGIYENLNKEELILEGIKFFKDSKKAEKFLVKLKKLASGIQIAEAKGIVMKAYSSLNKMRRELGKLEDSYKKSDNKEDKDALKSKHKEVANSLINEFVEYQSSMKESMTRIGKDARKQGIEEAVLKGTVASMVIAGIGMAVFGGLLLFNRDGSVVDVSAASIYGGAVGTGVFGLLNLAAESINNKRNAKFGFEAVKGKSKYIDALINDYHWAIDKIGTKSGKEYVDKTKRNMGNPDHPNVFDTAERVSSAKRSYKDQKKNNKSERRSDRLEKMGL